MSQKNVLSSRWRAKVFENLLVMVIFILLLAFSILGIFAYSNLLQLKTILICFGLLASLLT